MHDIEALLFVAGEEGLTTDDLCKQLEITPDLLTYKVMCLNQQLQYMQSSLQIIKQQQRYIMCTRPAYEHILTAYANQSLNGKLSQASLEVLAIIAYKQPLTRLEIDEIRGVQSAGAIQKLQLHHLIETVGRVDGPGRAKLFGTTDYFLDYFQLKSLDDLPPLSNESEEKEDTQLLFEQFSQTMEEI